MEDDEEEEEEEVKNGGSIHSHGAGGSSQASASSSCHSTPRKGKLPGRQPLNGHGKDRALCITKFMIRGGNGGGDAQECWRDKDSNKRMKKNEVVL